MKKLIFLLAGIAVTVQLSNCKKSSDDDDDTPTVNQLCDGNGKDSWILLDSTNHWDYKFTIAGQNQTSPTLTVGGTSVHGANTYRVISDDSHLMYFDDYEVREDAATHNIYKYNDNNGNEYLEVPGSPTLNQTWALSSGYSRKITNLSASLSTAGCNYTGLLEMIELDGNSATVQTYYFKKGLGMVKKQGTGAFGNVYVLTAVSLK